MFVKRYQEWVYMDSMKIIVVSFQWRQFRVMSSDKCHDGAYDTDAGTDDGEEERGRIH